MTRWFLGVDGGQSSTVALVGDETGSVRGIGRGGPCNHVATNESVARFQDAVGGAIREALTAAELSDSTRFEGACLGLSGGPADKDALARQIVPAEKYEIVTDAMVALTGALAGEPGVIAIAGTGSIAFGRNSAGKIARAGGWGYAFGDEGGAFDLVRQALRAALRHEEGWGPETALAAALRDAANAPDLNTLLHRFYTPEYPRARIAAYAKLIDEAARHGDAVAGDILKGAAQSLATYVAAVRRQLFHRGEKARVSYIGGVFSSDVIRERFILLTELEGEAHVIAPAFGPAGGALITAYRLVGSHVQLLNAPHGI